MSEETTEPTPDSPEGETRAPEEPEVPMRRQWVTLRGSSLDLRVGKGIVGGVAHDLASAIGRPRACALAAEPDAPAGLVEELRRGLTDQGFLVHALTLPEGDAAHEFSSMGVLLGDLADAGITSDDLVVAVGHAGSLSLAAAACAQWCGQVMLAVVPLDLASALTAGVQPRALDLPGHPRMVTHDGSARFEICDLDVLVPGSSDENALYARSVMVAAAMADSDKAFGALWDSADALVAGDEGTLVDAITECVRSKGKVASSTSVAIRQSADYGQTLRRALRSVAGSDVPESAIFADALRFAARLSVAAENFSIDDMFTQDELLERLGVGTVEAEVEPGAFVEAIKQERFARTNRFMLALPRAIGRVRLTAVETETLTEHVGAWCASR